MTTEFTLNPEAIEAIRKAIPHATKFTKTEYAQGKRKGMRDILLSFENGFVKAIACNPYGLFVSEQISIALNVQSNFEILLPIDKAKELCKYAGKKKYIKCKWHIYENKKNVNCLAWCMWPDESLETWVKTLIPKEIEYPDYKALIPDNPYGVSVAYKDFVELFTKADKIIKAQEKKYGKINLEFSLDTQAGGMTVFPQFEIIPHTETEMGKIIFKMEMLDDKETPGSHIEFKDEIPCRCDSPGMVLSLFPEVVLKGLKSIGTKHSSMLMLRYSTPTRAVVFDTDDNRNFYMMFPIYLR